MPDPGVAEGSFLPGVASQGCSRAGVVDVSPGVVEVAPSLGVSPTPAMAAFLAPESSPVVMSHLPLRFIVVFG